MRKPARRTKARKVDSRLSCRTVHLRTPPFRHPKNRSTRLRAFRSAFRRQNARFPPRVRFPRRRNPSRIAFASSAVSASTPFGRLRARPLPRRFTRRPPSTSSNRRPSCSFPGPTTTRKGSPSAFAQTRAFVPFRLLCPSIPTPSPGVSQNRRTTTSSCPTTRRGPTKLGHTPFPPFSPPPVWNRRPPPPPSPSPAYTPSPEGLAGSFARPPSPGVPETAARPSDRRHMGEADRTIGSR